MSLYPQVAKLQGYDLRLSLGGDSCVLYYLHYPSQRVVDEGAKACYAMDDDVDSDDYGDGGENSGDSRSMDIPNPNSMDYSNHSTHSNNMACYNSSMDCSNHNTSHR